jgi:hypothetical protein
MPVPRNIGGSSQTKAMVLPALVLAMTTLGRRSPMRRENVGEGYLFYTKSSTEWIGMITREN